MFAYNYKKGKINFQQQFALGLIYSFIIINIPTGETYSIQTYD
jgi:hypothetical protein